MPRSTVVILAGVMLLAAASAAERQSPTAEPIAPTSWEVFATYDRTEADCVVGNTEPPHWAVNGWLYSPEVYAVYCDPESCQTCYDPVGWKPVAVSMRLKGRQGGEDCYLNMAPAIYAVDLSNPDCPVPGDLVCVGDDVRIGPFPSGFSQEVTLALHGDCPAMVGPFFCAMMFTAADAGCSLPDEISIILAAGPCDGCFSWDNWGDGWYDLCEWGFENVAGLCLNATLHCREVDAVESQRWSSIKALYR